jgi:hypothetical protein
MENEMEFNVDDFLASIEKMKTPPREGFSGPRLNKILMHTKDNQGTVLIAPIFSKKIKNFFITISGVKEWHGSTTKLQGGIAWYKILPIEYYGELTTDEIELYDEVVGLWTELLNSGRFKYDKIRTRNYTLMTGFVKSHVDSSGKKIVEHENIPTLLIFPSLSPIDAMSAAISQKTTAQKGSKEWIPFIITPKLEGREGVIMLSFVKGPTSYQSTMGFEFNSKLNTVIEPDWSLSDDVLQLFDDPIKDFLGWQGGDDRYFNGEIFKELRDDMRITLKKLDSPTSEVPDIKLENKNGEVDPMISDKIDMKLPPEEVGDLPF